MAAGVRCFARSNCATFRRRGEVGRSSAGGSKFANGCRQVEQMLASAAEVFPGSYPSLIFTKASGGLGIGARATTKERRGRESNPRIEVLQTPTLPLGYPAGIENESVGVCFEGVNATDGPPRESASTLGATRFPAGSQQPFCHGFVMTIREFSLAFHWGLHVKSSPTLVAHLNQGPPAAAHHLNLRLLAAHD